MSLNMRIDNKMPGCYIVKLIGRLDGTTSAACEEKINPLLIPATKDIMFDMTNLDYISSMGLRIVIKTRNYVEDNGGGFHLFHMQPQIAKVFEIANLLRGIKTFATIKEADDYFETIQKKVLDTLR